MRLPTGAHGFGRPARVTVSRYGAHDRHRQSTVAGSRSDRAATGPRRRRDRVRRHDVLRGDRAAPARPRPRTAPVEVRGRCDDRQLPARHAARLDPRRRARGPSGTEVHGDHRPDTARRLDACVWVPPQRAGARRRPLHRGRRRCLLVVGRPRVDRRRGAGRSTGCADRRCHRVCGRRGAVRSIDWHGGERGRPRGRVQWRRGVRDGPDRDRPAHTERARRLSSGSPPFVCRAAHAPSPARDVARDIARDRVRDDQRARAASDAPARRQRGGDRRRVSRRRRV